MDKLVVDGDVDCKIKILVEEFDKGTSGTGNLRHVTRGGQYALLNGVKEA